MRSKHQDGEAAAQSATAWDRFLAVLGFLTRLPIPFRPIGPAEAAWAFPTVGLVVGAIGGLVLWLARDVGLSGWTAAFLAVAATALATGGLHEDGLADTFDGLWGGTTPERRLEIMRDSRIGVFGALALIIATGLKVSLLAGFDTALDAANALIAAHILARVVPAALMWRLGAASSAGIAAGAGKPRATQVALAAAIGLGLAVLVAGPSGLAGGLAALVILIASQPLLRAKLGGYNGDSLGASEQVTEIAVLIALATSMASAG